VICSHMSMSYVVRCVHRLEMSRVQLGLSASGQELEVFLWSHSGRSCRLQWCVTLRYAGFRRVILIHSIQFPFNFGRCKRLCPSVFQLLLLFGGKSPSAYCSLLQFQFDLHTHTLFCPPNSFISSLNIMLYIELYPAK